MDAAIAADVRRLEAFHMCCLQQLLDITWRDPGDNRTDAIARYPAQAMVVTVWSYHSTQSRCSRIPSPMNLSTGWKPNVRWRRTSGQPRKTWCSQIWIDVEMSPHNYCIHRGHSGVTQWSTRASR